MIRQMLVLLGLGLAACGDDRGEQPPAPVAPIAAAQERVSRPPEVVPKPSDQATLDRMILAGYTPHADHLHPPGVNKCPLSKGNEAVM